MSAHAAAVRKASATRSSWLLPAAVAVIAIGYVLGQQSIARRGPRAGDVAHRSPLAGAEIASLTSDERAAFIPAWDELKRRAQAEPIDPEWSSATEATIRRVVIAQLAPEVSIQQLRCGSSLCRVELRHPGSSRIAYEKFVSFTLHREILGAMELQLDTREDGVTQLYFLRNQRAFAAASRAKP